MALNKKLAAEIIPFPEKEKEEIGQVSELTYALLTIIAQQENRLPMEVVKDILARRKPDIDPTSAVLIFIVAYLSHYQQDRKSAKT